MLDFFSLTLNYLQTKKGNLGSLGSGIKGPQGTPEEGKVSYHVRIERNQTVTINLNRIPCISGSTLAVTTLQTLLVRTGHRTDPAGRREVS